MMQVNFLRKDNINKQLRSLRSACRSMSMTAHTIPQFISTSGYVRIFIFTFISTLARLKLK